MVAGNFICTIKKMTDVFSLKVEELVGKIKDSQITSVELCKIYIERINKFEKDVKAWAHFDKKLLLEKAAEADEHRNLVGIFTGGKAEQISILDSDLIVLIGLDPVELIIQPWPYDIPVLNISLVNHETHYVSPNANLIGKLSDNLEKIKTFFNKEEKDPHLVLFEEVKPEHCSKHSRFRKNCPECKEVVL